MKEINSKFNFRPARNAEHYQANNDIIAAVSAEFVTSMGILPLRTEYQRLLDIENDCYLRNAEYQETPEVEAKDKKRDDLFLYVSQTIATGELCPVENTRAAAARLAYMLKPYRDAPRLNYASNTAAVTDFVEKMQDEANRADVTALGLTDAIAALDIANKEFNTVYTGRSTQVLTRATSETMKTIRPQVDTAFKALASAINALYQVNELVTKDAAKEQSLGTVIDCVNALLIQLQTTLSRAGVGTKPSYGPEDKPTEQPSGGGESESPDEI